MKYRIKVNELNNGTMEYIPQIYLTSGEDQFNGYISGLDYPCWMPLKLIIFNKQELITIDNYTGTSCQTQREATNIIEKYQENAEKINALKVKNTTYIDYETFGE